MYPYLKAFEKLQNEPTLQEVIDTLDNNPKRLNKILDSEFINPLTKHIDISGKNLENICGLSAVMPNIESLNVNNNSLSHLTGAPSGIEKLYCAFNKLNNNSIYDKFVNLRILDISNNNISDLSCLYSLVHLRELTADNNLITCIPKLYFLLRLSLMNNNIEDLEFEKMPYLDFLEISGNKIKALIGIEVLTSLRTLCVSNNQISEVKIVEEMPLLKNLYLSKNSITSFDDINLNLDVLDLSFNELQGEALHIKSNLQELCISNQKHASKNMLLKFNFRDIDFGKYKDCSSISLSGNVFRNIKPLFGFFKLEILNLSNCHIRALPDNLSHGLPNIKVLNVAHNSLTDISPLKKLKRLRILILLDNELKKVSDVINNLKDLKKLKNLDLSHNIFNAKYYPAFLDFDDFKLNSSHKCKSQLKNKWEILNENFLKQINDITYVKRLCYRSALITELPRLEFLDSISICQIERDLAKTHYIKLKNRIETLTSSREQLNPDYTLESIRLGSTNNNKLQQVNHNYIINHYLNYFALINC